MSGGADQGAPRTKRPRLGPIRRIPARPPAQWAPRGTVSARPGPQGTNQRRPARARLMSDAQADAAILQMDVQESMIRAKVKSEMLARDARIGRGRAVRRVEPISRGGSSKRQKRSQPNAEGWRPKNHKKDPSWYRKPVPAQAMPKRGQTVTMMHTDTTYRTNYQTQRPVIELHGVTEHGNSVMVHVNDFDPHFSVAIPDYPYDDKDEYDVEELMTAFKRALEEVVRKEDKRFDLNQIRLVQRYEVSQKVSPRI